MKKSGYILGVSRGHNSGVCLLKDGEIVFSIEEERLSRKKYDGGPLAAITKVLEYTDKVDYVAIVHTQGLVGENSTSGKIEYTGDDIYTALCRKLGLIDQKYNGLDHPQVIDLSREHHKTHAAIAYHRSNFDSAVALVVDGAGSCYPTQSGLLWEVESIFYCKNNELRTVFKHLASNDVQQDVIINDLDFELLNDQPFSALISNNTGITKSYEAVTKYCGFSEIEAGKTMGLFPYGKYNPQFPDLINTNTIIPFVNKNVVKSLYPATATLNSFMFDCMQKLPVQGQILNEMQSRRDAAYWIQKSTQSAVLDYIIRACEMTGEKNVVLSGGYGLNCVANYYYLKELNKRDIKLYVEPISNDGGTAIGAALYTYHTLLQNDRIDRDQTLYLGPKYNYESGEIINKALDYKEDHDVEVLLDVEYSDIIDKLQEGNIVTMFQGRCENGPRALGNRSILYDPTIKNGKDFVNEVKRREYFRPFAASVLAEHTHDWFDLRGMEDSPHMMYAVNCKEGVESKIGSVIHEDGTCRIQTVTKDQNEHYYNLINEFFGRTGVPLLFNTSFNLGGEPLVETVDDALWTLSQSDLNYCYFPEHKLLIKMTKV